MEDDLLKYKVAGEAMNIASWDMDAVKDISEKKHMMDTILENQRAMQDILDSLPVGIRIMSQDDGSLVYANKASMDIFDCKDFERDVAGRSGFDFMPEIQPNGRTTVDMANELFQNEKSPMEFQCFKLGGEPFTARITSCNISFKGKLSSLADRKAHV